MLLIFTSYFAGKRIPRTESGLVGGNCAGKHGRADKGQEELELPGAGEELEDEDAEYGSGRAFTWIFCVFWGFFGHCFSLKRPRNGPYMYMDT